MGEVVRNAAFPSTVAGVSRSCSERAATVYTICGILVQSEPFLKHEQKAPENAGHLRKTSKGLGTLLARLTEGAPLAKRSQACFPFPCAISAIPRA